MSALLASKIRRPSMAASAKSDGLGDSRGSGEQGLELQVGEPQGERFGGHRGTADVLSGRVLHHSVDDTAPVELGRDGEPAGDGSSKGLWLSYGHGKCD
jgi:hypothetical protein